MEAYAETLRAVGAVVEWVRAGGMDCVLKSQLVRMIAFAASDVVRPEDLVMTVDVNAFPMNDRYLWLKNHFVAKPNHRSLITVCLKLV